MATIGVITVFAAAFALLDLLKALTYGTGATSPPQRLLASNTELD